MAKRTPLYDRHVAAGARMVDFGGYDMPLQYTGMREEHVAVRERAGLFDISHMGEVTFEGPQASAAVDRLVANDVTALAPGRALYGVMCNSAGGIVDDVIVYRDGADALMVVVNAGCHDKDLAWMREHASQDSGLVDRSDDTALLAVQGPAAVGIVQTLTTADVFSLRPFRFSHGLVAGVEARISRTGYTGEDGVELYVEAASAPRLWDALLEAGDPRGLVPAGLGARDTLRLEAGLRLYGQDMDESIDPLSCGLGWTVKLDRGDFIGRDPVQRIVDSGGPARMLTGLALSGRAIARHGQQVVHDGVPVGAITSGTFSFSLGHGIATAYLPTSLGAVGTILGVDIRGTLMEAAVTPLPFRKRPPAEPAS